MKHKRSRLLAILALPLLVGIAAVRWWPFGPNDESNSSVSSTAKVIRRDFCSSVLATGAVKPQVGAEVRVGARISGKVERLHANIGDFVKKGQVIAELEKADLAAVVAQSRAELAMAEARLSSVKALRPCEAERAEAELDQRLATLELAKKELARQDDLLERDFTSQQARDRAQERLSVAKAQHAAAVKTLELARTRHTEDCKQAQADLARAKAALENAEVWLSYATISAPIDGVIASVSTQEGETVSAGLSAPTFVTIIDLKRLQVDAFVDEVDIGKIQNGQKVVFTVDAFPAREFGAEVVAIYPKAVIQENVVNYDVVAEIADPYDGLLRPEMTASVTIFLRKREQVLALPAKAVKREGGRTVAYVLASGGPERRDIKVGWQDGGWIEIVSGLAEGDTVLLAAPAAESVKP